jgi:WD40 repeat protein
MGGGYFASVGAIASNDGRYILAVSSAAVKIFSSTTAEQVGHLSGHTADITAIVLDPHSSKKVS